MIVLDASAVLAMVLSEPGGNTVTRVISGASMSSVNWAEVLEKQTRPAQRIRLSDDLRKLGLKIEPATENHAILAAELKTIAPRSVLSLGDRFCLALGKERSAEVYTADRVWQTLPHGVTIRLIR